MADHDIAAVDTGDILEDSQAEDAPQLNDDWQDDFSDLYDDPGVVWEGDDDG